MGVRAFPFWLIVFSILSWATRLNGQCTIQGPNGTVCADQTFEFSVSNPGSSTYEWDFDGDGAIDETGSEVAFRFPAMQTDQSYTVELFRDGASCATRNLTVQSTPDPAIGIPASGNAAFDDDVIRICSGDPGATVSIFNDSRTMSINESYTVDWGDGSPPETYDNNSFNNTTLISHTYEGFGFYSLTVEVTGSASCSRNVGEYQVYIGSNPSVGLGNPGNTVGLCAPVTLTFPITGTADNASGTKYEVFINGEKVADYTQANVPPYFTYTFTETSCGESTSTGNYENAYDLQLIASNPCGTSTATVEPIEISEPPEPMFLIMEDMTCTGTGIVFENASEINEVLSGGRCESELMASWAISGEAGVDWVVVNGNLFNANEIEVDFNNPGTYEITITINSSACGAVSFSQEVTISDSPHDVGASASMDTQGGCAPGTVTFLNNSGGENLEYNWSVVPASGWSYTNGTNENSADPEYVIERGGEYAFSMSAGNVCGTINWDTTLVFQGPPIVKLQSPPDACLEGELDFNGTLVQYDDRGNPISEYYWEFPGAEQTSSYEAFPKDISYSAVGIYGYRVAVTNACGTSVARDTFRVIDPAPVQMPALGLICENEAAFQLEPVPRGGIWAGPGVSASGLFRPSEAGVGTHMLSYRFGEGLCQVEGDLLVEVVAAPAADAGPQLSACTSDAGLDLAGTPAGGTWSGEFVDNGRFRPAQAGEGPHWVYYTITDNQGCTGLDSTRVEVLPPPEVSVEDLIFCEDSGPTALPDGLPANGAWSGPGVTDNSFAPKEAGGAGVYTLTYEVTDGNGCVGSAQSTVEVLSSSAIEAGPNLKLCASDAPVDLSPQASPAGGTWTSSGGGLSGAIFDPSQVAPGFHTLSYEIEQGECLLTDELTVEVVETPVIDFGEIPTFICDGNSQVTLSASPGGGIWSTSSDAVFSEEVFNAEASGPGVYVFEYRYQAGSCVVVDSVEITVGELPEVSVRDTVFCNGPGRVILPPAIPTGGRWSGPGVENNFFYPERAGGVGNYQLEYRYVKGGCVVSGVSNVEVIATVSVDAGPDDDICMTGGDVELSGFSPEGGRWDGPGIADRRLGIFDPVEAGSGVHQVVYSVGNSGCVVRDTLQLTVIEPLEVSPGPDLEACPGDSPLPLQGATPGGGVWSGEGVSGDRFDPAGLEDGEYLITYSVRDDLSGCVTTAERPVTVHPQPRSLFQAPTSLCTGDTVLFTNDSRGAMDHRWDFGDGGTSALAEPEHIYSEKGNYEVFLITTNEFGCSDTLGRNLTVSEPPEAVFAPDGDEGCAPLSVSFENRSVGENMAYEWDFGNGQRTSRPTPEPVSYDQGATDTTYLVKLRVQNQCGIDSLIDTVTVFPAPLADFGTPVDTSCNPMEVEFTNRTLGNPEFFEWDLGNGVRSTDSLPPNQIYHADSTLTAYTISLIAGNECGQDTASRRIFVKPNNVNAFFNLPAREACAPFSVQFTNLATPGAYVSWDFGDGNRSSAVNPQYTYEEAGEYQVRQFATNGCGLDTVAQMIRVLPAPTVGFAHPQFACVDEPVTFINESEGAIGQQWSFGDGDSSEIESPVHQYDTPGVYPIHLVVFSSENQCVARDSSELTVLGKPEASFIPSTPSGCAPLQVRFDNNNVREGFFYEWDFGDGNTASVDRPTHVFSESGTFSIKLRVTDVNGCSTDTSVQQVIVHPMPEARFSFEEEVLCGVPADIILNNESIDASGFRWNFGDGTTSSLNQPDPHTYYEGGEYDIQLIATNTFQCADTLVRRFEVLPLPEMRYEIGDRRGCVPMTVEFNNYAAANHYYWDFGDGAGSLEPNPVHTYTQPGTYDVQLVAAYDDACFDTLFLEAEIEIFPAPYVDFEMETDPDGPPGSVRMVNLSEGATKFFWDFGDGTTSEEANPTHRYYDNRTRQVYLRGTNVFGCVADTIKAVAPPLLKGLFIPNAFSPEAGLGEVRLFKPKGAGLKEYKVQVFSPYGQLVWESDKLEEGQPAEAWDGTMNGQLLPQDVYVWKAFGIFEDGTAWRGMPDGNGNYKTIGSVTLLR